MTKRSILAGERPTVIIKTGGSVIVKGQPGDQVQASSEDKWGLKVEKKSAAEFARARVEVSDHLLFDWHFTKPGAGKAERDEEVIEVQLGGSGEVLVPQGAWVKVYTGKHASVEGVEGRVDAYTGLKLTLRSVGLLGHASAGSAMDVECRAMAPEVNEYKAGGDLRFYVRGLDNLRLRVKDIGGYWEGVVGSGEKDLYLKCGGDVTFVTAAEIKAVPPDFILGHIEPPPAD